MAGCPMSTEASEQLRSLHAKEEANEVQKVALQKWGDLWEADLSVVWAKL